MSESKGKILFVILAILLLLFGGGTILYPSLNGLCEINKAQWTSWKEWRL